MRIAIVGGGIFGVSSAWLLSKNGHSVDLFEEKEDLLLAASGINQYRLHRGYHYPRSKETVIMSLTGEPGFKYAYGDALLNNKIEHYYSISKNNSLSSPEECLKIWKDCDLEYEKVNLDIVNNEKIALSVKVKEHLFDPNKLREICWNYLKKYKVNVITNKKIELDNLKDYDLIVIATYSKNNSLLDNFPGAKKDYQYELCEKPILKLSQKYKDKSVVILDGPFMCIDPFSDTDYHVMGNVVHAIHQRTIGKLPEIPKGFKNLLNRGIVKNPPITNINKFISSAEEFFPG
ncbi:MAG: FAD-dependent oxidoreductase, partial [Nanoarchaeota archaeon]